MIEDLVERHLCIYMLNFRAMANGTAKRAEFCMQPVVDGEFCCKNKKHKVDYIPLVKSV